MVRIDLTEGKQSLVDRIQVCRLVYKVLVLSRRFLVNYLQALLTKDKVTHPTGPALSSWATWTVGIQILGGQKGIGECDVMKASPRVLAGRLLL